MTCAYEYLFASHKGRQIDKWQHYFEIYDRHLGRYANQKVRVLEIGVDHGGSLQLWRRFFGKHAEIIGIDIPLVVAFEAMLGESTGFAGFSFRLFSGFVRAPDFAVCVPSGIGVMQFLFRQLGLRQMKGWQ